MKNSARVSRMILLLILTLGLLSIQASFWPGISQRPPTRTPTATEFILGGGGNNFCGNGCAELNLWIQYHLMEQTRAVKSSFCGRLVPLTEYKGKNLLPNKQVTRTVLGLVPCKGAGIYIMNMRPRELYGYYEFVNVVKSTGRKTNTKEFGPINTYIDRFQTYYPLNSCGECGQVSQGFVPYSTQEVVFPVLTQPPGAPLILPSATPVAASPTVASTPSPTNSPLPPSPTLTVMQSQAAAAVLSSPAAPVSAGVQDGSGSQPLANAPQIEPPADQPLVGFLSYSLYTLLLIPLIVLMILVRQKRPL